MLRHSKQSICQKTLRSAKKKNKTADTLNFLIILWASIPCILLCYIPFYCKCVLIKVVQHVRWPATCLHHSIPCLNNIMHLITSYVVIPRRCSHGELNVMMLLSYIIVSILWLLPLKDGNTYISLLCLW